MIFFCGVLVFRGHRKCAGEADASLILARFSHGRGAGVVGGNDDWDAWCRALVVMMVLLLLLLLLLECCCRWCRMMHWDDIVPCAFVLFMSFLSFWFYSFMYYLFSWVHSFYVLFFYSFLTVIFSSLFLTSLKGCLMGG